MNKTVLAVSLFLLGLCLGSFVNAGVWRIKHKKDIFLDRSECIRCHYKLGIVDLIPVVSWLSLGGRCRKCSNRISAQYPLVELATGALFVLSLAFWPFGFTTTPNLLLFVLWLLACVVLVFLFVYDLKWLILPDKAVAILALLGLGMAVLYGMKSSDIVQFFQEVAFSLLILSGFYLLLYIYSKGKWIGFGDVKLGVGLALLLCNWQLALIALFLANLFGTLVFTPLMVVQKVKRTSHIPFGPFLIAGTIVAMLWGQSIVEWYNAVVYIGITPNQLY
jgi:leader peptidase (prepilin peptidase)/N-methyltransferase